MSNLKEKIDTSATGQKKRKDADADTPLAQKMRSTLHDTVDALAEKAEAAEKTIRNTAGDSKETLNETQQRIQESWEASSVRKYATENPVATAGIVFIAGALFGKFLSRN